MRQFFVGLLWLGVLASLSVYAYRIWRRVTQGPKSVREANKMEVQAAAADAAVDQPSPTAELFRDAVQNAPPQPEPPPLPQPPLPQPGPPQQGPTGSDGPGSSGMVAPVGSSGGSAARRGPTFVPAPSPAQDPPVGGGSRGGLFASRPNSSDDTGGDADSARPDSAALRPTVAEALAGIAMPCGLAPLIDPVAELNPHRVAFSTDGIGAAEVGSKIGDELERLGFTLRSVSDVAVDATKASTLVHVVLHPEAATEMTGDARAYPTIPANAIVVEFST